ncbi:hypothetical protein BS47DRAFT_1370133 [Hydnum rufescens UP504]|uniref:Uncharacterized protein n=1 Tax=Hydnum rufescens UP504 TaxID=1448309 RepID=A0A9P6A9U6_9AGAM|nr:hypothetical protein BS47DRAFT_1370133 [Hydnum rufescens UP504]
MHIHRPNRKPPRQAGIDDHTPAVAGVWSYKLGPHPTHDEPKDPHDMPMRTQHSNTTRQCNATRQRTVPRQRNAPCQCNTPCQRAQDMTCGAMPNEDVAASNGDATTPNEDAPPPNVGTRNHTPTPAGVWSYVRSRLLLQANTDANPPPQPHLSMPERWGGHTNRRAYEPAYYPTPAGVGYKILNQNPHEPPSRNPPNETPRTITVNEAPQMKTDPLEGVPKRNQPPTALAAEGTVGKCGSNNNNNNK